MFHYPKWKSSGAESVILYFPTVVSAVFFWHFEADRPQWPLGMYSQVQWLPATEWPNEFQIFERGREHLTPHFLLSHAGQAPGPAKLRSFASYENRMAKFSSLFYLCWALPMLVLGMKQGSLQAVVQGWEITSTAGLGNWEETGCQPKDNQGFGIWTPQRGLKPSNQLKLLYGTRTQSSMDRLENLTHWLLSLHQHLDMPPPARDSPLKDKLVA